MGVRARDEEDDEIDVTVPSKRRATFDMSKLLEALTAATSSHGNNADALKSIRELLSLRRVICVVPSRAHQAHNLSAACLLRAFVPSRSCLENHCSRRSIEGAPTRSSERCTHQLLPLLLCSSVLNC